MEHLAHDTPCGLPPEASRCVECPYYRKCKERFDIPDEKTKKKPKYNNEKVNFNGIVMDSGLETGVASMLEVLGAKWQYHPKQYRNISLQGRNGKIYRYSPDFYIFSFEPSKVLEEVPMLQPPFLLEVKGFCTQEAYGKLVAYARMKSKGQILPRLVVATKAHFAQWYELPDYIAKTMPVIYKYRKRGSYYDV